jgi:thiol-disulfide isomerase/thioredoxin
MNRVWLAAFGAAVLIIAALNIYLEQGSSSLERKNVSASRQGNVFSLLTKRAKLPDVAFVDGDGRATKLSDFRGKTILLNVWATWCAPCRKEMPALDRLQAKLGDAGFEVVALSIDRGGAWAVKSFYEELGIEGLRVYVDATARASSDLGAIGLPTTLLIDPQGREIGRKVGPAEWDSSDVVKAIRSYLETPEASASVQGLLQ